MGPDDRKIFWAFFATPLTCRRSPGASARQSKVRTQPQRCFGALCRRTRRQRATALHRVDRGRSLGVDGDARPARKLRSGSEQDRVAALDPARQREIGGKGRLPTADDLRSFEYRYRGYLWDAFVMSYGDDEGLLYSRDAYIASHLDHNRSVSDYFRHRPDDLLVINVGDPGAMQKLCLFLGVPYHGQAMPHLSRTA